MASFNIEGAFSNFYPLQKLLKEADFVCLQEHWVLNFEKDYFIEHSNQALDPHRVSAYIKSVDDSNPFSHIQRPRGYSGSGIMWKSEYDPLVTVVPDGSHRFTAILVATEQEKDLCIVSAYLPSRGKAGQEEKYASALDELHEIISKYTSTHHMIICGDFNACLWETRCSRDRKFQNFVTEELLRLPNNYPEVPTHYHHNGCDKSAIDFIITKTEQENLVGNVKVLEGKDGNTSPHCPIVATCQVKIARTQHPQRGGPTVRWEAHSLEKTRSCYI